MSEIETRRQAEHALEEYLDALRERGEIPGGANYFDCGELGIVYVYMHAHTWWFRWVDLETKPAPWLEAGDE